MARNGNGFLRYKSYNFTTKDPIIDALRGPVSSSKMSYNKIHEAGGPAYATMRNWFHGKTRRPQFATVAATIRAIGKGGVKFSSNSGNPHLID